MQSTVSLKIINPPKHDSLSRISGQSEETGSSRGVLTAVQPPSLLFQECETSPHLCRDGIQSILRSRIDMHRPVPCIPSVIQSCARCVIHRRSLRPGYQAGFAIDAASCFERPHMARKCAASKKNISHACGLVSHVAVRCPPDKAHRPISASTDTLATPFIRLMFSAMNEKHVIKHPCFQNVFNAVENPSINAIKIMVLC